MSKPRLSLCMIIRDEEQMLGPFLEAAAGLWDELCVVDTGSRDRSIDMLCEAGARLEEIPWQEDFSLARNASLEMATGDWILFLDADERVTPELKSQVRRLLIDDSAGAATLVMRNRMAHGHRHDSVLLRMFRNDPVIRFRFPIHEEVASSVNAFLERTGLRLVHLPGVVEHLGYSREVMAEKDKKQRDCQLLDRCLQQDPDDFYSHFKLLELARFWGDQSLLAASAQNALQRLESAGREKLRGFDYVGELIALVAEGAFAGDLAKMRDFLLRWPQPASAAYLLKRAEVAELQGDFAAARDDFQACLALGSDRLEQLVTVRPHLGLARIAMAQGDFGAAAEHAARGLEAGPRDPEALLASVTLRRLPGVESLEDFLTAYRSEYGEPVELHQALGEDAFLAAEYATAARELQIAAAANPEDLKLRLRFAQALLGSGNVDQALAEAEALQADLPEAAAGLIVCLLLKERDLDFQIDISLEELDRALRAWVAVLQGSGQGDLQERFRHLAPAVAHLFPWLENF